MAVLSIISRTLPPVEVEQAYSEDLQVVGGVAPYTWSLVPGFGTLPTGMTLSASGTLGALVGVISPVQVGTYSFRLKVVDGVAADEVFDYTLEIIPYGFDRVPSFLLDSKVERNAAQQLLELLSRLKNEKHFRHGSLGLAGSPWVHLDEDVKVPDWTTPGNDLGLREVLDALYLLAKFSMRSINSIDPDWVTRDFTLQQGTGINITPIVNGLQLDVDLSGLPSLTPVELEEGDLTPGSTLALDLDSSTFIADLLIKTDGLWYQREAIPSSVGKQLNAVIAAASPGVLGMAVGDSTTGPKLHVLWQDPTPSMVLSRYDGLTLAHEEDYPLPVPPIPPLCRPLVMTGIVGQVIIAYPEATNGFIFGVLNPDNYTDTSLPSYLNPPIAIPPLMPAFPNPSTNAWAGAVAPPTSAAAGLAYILSDVGGNPMVSEWDTMTPGASGGLTLFKPFVGGGGLDLVVDSASNVLNMALVGALAGPADPLELWQDNIPMVPGPLFGPQPLLVVGTGGAVSNACLVVGNSVPNPGARAGLLAYTYGGGTWPLPNSVRYVSIDNIQLVPAGGPISPGTWNPNYEVDGANSAFLKSWTADESEAVLLFPTNAITEGEVERLIFNPNTALKEQGIIRRAKPSPAWIRGAHTVEGAPNAQNLRFYDEQNVLGAAETTFSDENLHLRYNEGTNELVAVNDSPFSWHVKITAIQQSGFASPPSLLIPAWQVAQALQNYYNGEGYFPSPSSSGANGVTWSELELATTPTVGVQFDTYYTVTPGEYDLNGGATASAYYHSLAVAGSASDQTLVFQYDVYPSEIGVAEAAIKAAVDAYLASPAILPPPVGNYYSLPELDVVLGTSFATTYTGLPYDLYRYFLFVDTSGTLYFHGYFSKNYVESANAYGPAPVGTSSVEIPEHFGPLLADDVAGVPHDFSLAQGVLSARFMVNGVEYYQGIHWAFQGNNVIRYLNDPADYVLSIGDQITVWKYVPA